MMVSLDMSSPARISFSGDLLKDGEEELSKKTTMLSIIKTKMKKQPATASEEKFEFLCSSAQKMVSADELFSDGKLLPYWQQTKKETVEQQQQQSSSISNRVSWGFMDDDPSPRPPKCTVLWKELLRIKKNKPHSSLSPSSSSSSSNSSSSMAAAADDSKKKTESSSSSSNYNLKKRIQRGLERTTSATIRIRPILNVPNLNTSSLPPLFPIKKRTSL